MSMNYVVRKKVDKSGDKEVVRYYAASKVLQPGTGCQAAIEAERYLSAKGLI